MSGPLKGLEVIEMAGIGPGPLAGQLLADLGADVIVIDRAEAPADKTDVNRRGKRSVFLDLKSEEGRSTAQALINRAGIVIEGFRPGVMERLGLGPDDLDETVIFGRITGWGQDGPLSQSAGHDINYLALTGALHAMGSAGAPPVPPLNMVADYGGGTMFLLFGILSAVIERGVTGKGQVVDAAMVDGVPAMMGLIHGMLAQGTWTEERAANWLDGAAPFYRCYTCADGKFISVGALEPQFYAILLEKLGLPADLAASQNDRATWEARTAEFAAIFATRARDDWAAHFGGSDACVAPVLSFAEAPDHPQMAARGNVVKVDAVLQSGRAPRFGATAPQMPSPPRAIGADTDAVLAELGLRLDRA